MTDNTIKIGDKVWLVYNSINSIAKGVVIKTSTDGESVMVQYHSPSGGLSVAHALTKPSDTKIWCYTRKTFLDQLLEGFSKAYSKQQK